MPKKNRPLFSPPPNTGKQKKANTVTPTPVTPVSTNQSGNNTSAKHQVSTKATNSPTDDDAFAHLLDKVALCYTLGATADNRLLAKGKL